MPATMDWVQHLMGGLAKRPVRSLLAGAYASIFTGRSLDFEDLREYVAGDDVAAIDWKATARSTKVLIRRSKAERRHHLILVVDTSLDMTASAPDGWAKSDLAGLIAGMFIYLALGHGDLVSAHWGDQAGCHSLPPRGRPAHGDMLLAAFNQAWQGQPGQADLPGLLEHTTTATRRRGAAVVISDDLSLSQPATGEQIRQLHARHEVMVLRVADLAPTLPWGVPGNALPGANTRLADHDSTGERSSSNRLMPPVRHTPRVLDAVDLTSGAVFTATMSGGPAAARQAAELDWQRDQAVISKLTGQGIATVRVDSYHQVLPKVIEALERHRHVAR